MSAFTDPSIVPIHSPTTGTSICTTGTTRTSTGRGGGASLRAQAAASRRAVRAKAERAAPANVSASRNTGCSDRFRTEPDRGDDGEHDERHEHDPLRHDERRLRLLGGQRAERGNLEERLHHADEDVQVEGPHGAD